MSANPKILLLALSTLSAFAAIPAVESRAGPNGQQAVRIRHQNDVTWCHPNGGVYHETYVLVQDFVWTGASWQLWGSNILDIRQRYAVLTRLGWHVEVQSGFWFLDKTFW